jgi:hypothetical protein
MLLRYIVKDQNIIFMFFVAPFPSQKIINYLYGHSGYVVFKPIYLHDKMLHKF